MMQSQLTVHQDGSWFRVNDQERVDLHSRARYRVLLQMLVREHLRDPSATISLSAVICGVWPDERLRHTVARNRAYVALCTLRKWGLEGLVLRTQQGYRLDPNLRVTVVDGQELPPVAAGSLEEPSRPAEHAIATAEHAIATTEHAAVTAEHACIEERTSHEESALDEQRALHSMRVRRIELPLCEDRPEALRRLVG